MAKKRRVRPVLRPGLNINLVPGLSVYLSTGKTGARFHVRGHVKRLLAALAK